MLCCGADQQAHEEEDEEDGRADGRDNDRDGEADDDDDGTDAKMIDIEPDVPEPSIAIDAPQQVTFPQQYYNEFLEALDNVKGPPIWVVNDIDAEPCPPLVFHWVDECVLGENVPSRDSNFTHGCSCPNGECDLTKPLGCECLDDLDVKRFSYNMDGLMIHPPGMAVIECNSRCRCSRSCPNRVVERGRRMPLELFKTANKGWGTSSQNSSHVQGVRTCRTLPKGMFICRYIGEVITDAEAERRGQEYDRKVRIPMQFS
jgi:Pre-SET motif